MDLSCSTTTARPSTCSPAAPARCLARPHLGAHHGCSCCAGGQHRSFFAGASAAGLRRCGRSRGGPSRGALSVLAARQITVDVDKPVGLKLEQSKAPGGGLVVKGVQGNARSSGIKVGDTVVYTSSFFGDELWPADSVNFARSALNACPSPVTITYVQGENKDVFVKRLVKKPAPARFGTKLTRAQKELATHICIDCGYIYCQSTPFEEQANSYRCPQCRAPKRRFARYDPESGKRSGGVGGELAQTLTVVAGLAGIGALLYVGLQL